VRRLGGARQSNHAFILYFLGSVMSAGAAEPQIRRYLSRSNLAALYQSSLTMTYALRPGHARP
jgi:hypothetical protein